MKKELSLLITAIILFTYQNSFGLSIRGMPEGKSRIEVGDKAPLETEALKKAHAEGKIILLMFGNPTHCIYCDKVSIRSNNLMKKYPDDVSVVIAIHRAAKFWGPDTEDAKLGKLYNVIGEPWLFLIDKEGIVRHIFMGLATQDAIETELKKVLVLK